MRRLAALAPAVLLAAIVGGCGADNGSGAAAPATGFVGTWIFDRGTLASPPPNNAQAALDQVMKMMPKVSVEYTFAADGTFTLKEQVMSKDPSLLSGTWELRDGKYLVTEKEKNGKPRSPTDKYNTVSMELKDGDLSFNPPGAPIVFHLKRK